MPRRIAALAAASGVAALLAIPTAASAATGHATKACYTHVPTKGSEPLTVALSGGTPGADYIVAATVPGRGTGSAGSTDGQFDAAGNALATITDVFPPNGTIEPTRGQKVALSVADYGSPDTSDMPIGTTLITTLALDVSSKPSSPSARRRVTVSGTPFAHKKVYGFIVKGKGKRVLRRISLGTGDVCGYTSAKQVVAPPGAPTGSYRLYVNAGKKLNKKKALAYAFTITRHYF